MTAARPWSGRRLHFVGVGGAGMSAYARAAHALGAQVSGSDRAESVYSAALAADGVLVAAIGHRAENLPQGEGLEVVCSSAIGAENVERVAALERGLAVLARAALLGELTALRRTIAVAGAHGKTTTSAMIVAALRAGGLDPGYLIGGVLRESGRNGEWRESEWLVVEADESDRSLLELHVEIAVLTNVELDHHDAYGSLAELEDVYRRFLAGAAQAVIWDRPELLALREGSSAPFDARDVQLGRGVSRLHWEGVELELPLAGLHNARNAVAALRVARLAGVAAEDAARGLRAFAGTARRFERLGVSGSGAEVYDDYAHHPSEIAATLAAARTLAPRRLVAVFQPHLYSRTLALARELGAALAAADAVVVLDVYPARERAEDFPGTSGLRVAEAAADAAAGRAVYWMPVRAAARAAVGTLSGAGDLVVVMGAGDIDELGRELAGESGG
ncbi:MAG TPA: UDP-N-acetylmuramate--L-alanine ligase [Solirubrobacteraceae bacterium]|nr:UDP-N-acetylmuramate--L-alanine ligase [Solirubrobacteraceae bacterium]